MWFRRQLNSLWVMRLQRSPFWPLSSRSTALLVSFYWAICGDSHPRSHSMIIWLWFQILNKDLPLSQLHLCWIFYTAEHDVFNRNLYFSAVHTAISQDRKKNNVSSPQPKIFICITNWKWEQRNVKRRCDAGATKCYISLFL